MVDILPELKTKLHWNGIRCICGHVDKGLATVVRIGWKVAQFSYFLCQCVMKVLN